MRKLLIILILGMCASAQAQEPVYNQMRNNYQFRGIRVDSLLLIPKFTDTSAAAYLNGITGALIRVDSSVYMRFNKWLKLNAIGTTIDTTSLSNRINQRVKYTDTAVMLDPYLREADTSSLSYRIDTRVKYTDTSAMLQVYLRKADTVTLSQNFFNTDLQATDDRIHNFKWKNLTIDSIQELRLNSTNPTIVNRGSKIFANQDQISLTTYGRLPLNNSQFLLDSSKATLYFPNNNFYVMPKTSPQFGQVVGYTANNQLGYVLRVDSLRKSNDSIFAYKGTTWTYQFKDATGSTDTTSLSNRIDLKIDSLKKSSDSVYFKKSGTWYYSFRDSIGGGSNGRFGNDTATVVMAKVHNDAGSTLTNGEVVYLATSGTSSDVPSVKRAINKADSTSANTFGFVHGNIANNDTGYVVLSGKIEKLNTAAFANGDIIYLDSIAGKWTKSKPQAPYHLVYLGVVIKANPGNGSIFVKPVNGYEIEELHDVQINNRINNQIIAYSDTQKVWKNRNVWAVVDTSTWSARIDQRVKYSDTATLSNRIDLKLNISDTSVFLRDGDSAIYQTKFRSDTARTNTYTAIAGREAPLTFSTGLTRSTNTITSNLSTGVAGGQSVVGGTASGNNLTLSSTSNATKGKILFGTSGYDEVNNRLGIGTNSPGTAVQINLTNTNFTNASGAGSHIYMTNPSTTGQNVVSSFINGTLAAKWRTDYVGNISWVAGGSGEHAFYTGGDFGTGSMKMRITNGGNTIIGSAAVGGTLTDAGFRLDVNGTARASAFQLSALNTAPASASATGTTGEIRIVNGFIYVCVATNTWQRATLSTW